MAGTVAVVGAGYVGLTTAAGLAHLGHDVTAVDVDEAKVAGLSEGRVPIVEAGLDELVAQGLAAGRLRFTTDPAATAAAELAFLCVPTPQHPDGSVDLAFVEAAAAAIGPHLPPDAVVVNKSTAPVGATRLVQEALGRTDVTVVSNPEFLREGSAVEDFLHPDRVVIGADDPRAAERVAALYAPLGARLVVTDPASAETIKYASNAYLAARLSFVNALAAVCEAVGADVGDVVRGMGLDRRIGPAYLRPGPGWGGSCFPKDTRALLSMAVSSGEPFELLAGVISANEEQFDRVVGKVARLAGGSLDGRRVAVWGLTFKAGTDDLRDSPALAVVARLVAAGAEVRAHDPVVRGPLPGHPDVEVVPDAYAACQGADVLVVLTEWEEFSHHDLGRVAAAMAARAVVDGRNLLDPAALAALGFAYEGIGRSGRGRP